MSEFVYGKIKEINDFEGDGLTGYEIITENANIKVSIDTFQSCCEDFGKKVHYALDKLEDFVGSEVKTVAWGKDRKDEDNCDYGSAVVAIDTSKGLLQVEVYNDHNGYYPHTVYVEWHNYKDTQDI